ncbi:hypothetical protein [Methylocella sp.]|uniref:hypothetical protein n=1 Tax=Methylocella sp. TaxID=1978226 RepID=UPI00378398AA
MIEQAMAFALGFAAAGLIALAIAPAFWARAVRLVTRRLELAAPLSMREIVAGRDLLRAEFAVERRALEQKAAQLRAERAADRIEIGRRTIDMAALRDSLAQLADEGAAKDDLLVRLRRALHEKQAECAAALSALHAAEGLEERDRAEAMALRRSLLDAEARLAAHEAAGREETALLRESVREIGAAVARLASAGALPPPEAAPGDEALQGGGGEAQMREARAAAS